MYESLPGQQHSEKRFDWHQLESDEEVVAELRRIKEGVIARMPSVDPDATPEETAAAITDEILGSGFPHPVIEIFPEVSPEGIGFKCSVGSYLSGKALEF